MSRPATRGWDYVGVHQWHSHAGTQPLREAQRVREPGEAFTATLQSFFPKEVRQ